MADRYSRLGASSATFDSMIQRFGVVTVMNAKIYEVAYEGTEPKTVDEVLAMYSEAKPLATLDTLKIANANQDGPDKTVTGGQYSNPLIKFGKSARLEMQDALGNNEALDALCGTISEYRQQALTGRIALHVGEQFAGPKCIIGDSFFIEQRTGAQVPVKIIFYQFLPDSLFNLTQDPEGDATVFDMNGDLMTTVIHVGNSNGELINAGVFYSIIDAKTVSLYSVAKEDGKITIKEGYTATLDGADVTSGTTAIAAGQAGRLIIKDANSNVVLSVIVER